MSCQARRGHASALLDYSRKYQPPEPPSTMVPLALCKMLLLLNQIAHETPIINPSTRLSSNLEIKCWTMFTHPALPWHGLLPSVPPPFQISVTLESSEILPHNHTSIILALIFRTFLHTSVCPEGHSILPSGKSIYNSDGDPQSRDQLLLLEEPPALHTPQCQPGTEQGISELGSTSGIS